MRPRAASCDRAAGFSLVEVLIATLLFFIVAISVMPFFSRSMLSNRAGADATTVTQFGLSRVEEMMAPPLDNPSVDPGTTSEYYSATDEVWKTGTPPETGDRASWTRVTRITQHSLSDLESDGAFDDPLPVGADESTIHLKLIEVQVGMLRGESSPLGRRPDLALRTLRPY